MKEEDILKQAAKALNAQQVPPGPPGELKDSTAAKLAELSRQEDIESKSRKISFIDRMKAASGFLKFAAAAVLLVVAGYAVGRLLSPGPPDIEQLQAALEPAIRSRLVDEMKQYLQLGLANSYVRLRDDLTQQYRSDLSRYATQTLAASSAVTNQLLKELIESINQAQTQDRQWFTAAIRQIEINRLRDNAQLTNALAAFAVQTEDELLRTKQDMAQILAYTQPESLNPDRFEDPNNFN
jgi:hypothetical protein